MFYNDDGFLRLVKLTLFLAVVGMGSIFAFVIWLIAFLIRG